LTFVPFELDLPEKKKSGSSSSMSANTSTTFFCGGATTAGVGVLVGLGRFTGTGRPTAEVGVVVLAAAEVSGAVANLFTGAGDDDCGGSCTDSIGLFEGVMPSESSEEAAAAPAPLSESSLPAPCSNEAMALVLASSLSASGPVANPPDLLAG